MHIHFIAIISVMFRPHESGLQQKRSRLFLLSIQEVSGVHWPQNFRFQWPLDTGGILKVIYLVLVVT